LQKLRKQLQNLWFSLRNPNLVAWSMMSVAWSEKQLQNSKEQPIAEPLICL
jgi:hypothetical protein